MPNKRTSMEKILRLLELKESTPLSIRALSRALNLSRPAIAKYLCLINAATLTYAEAKGMSEAELLCRLKLQQPPAEKKENKQKYEELSGYFEYMLKELKRVGVTMHLLWEEYKEKHPLGYEYSQFCYHFNAFLKGNELTMHLEHKAGDKMFVDFTGHKFTIQNRKTGAASEAEVFVAILGASQYTYVEACQSQKKEDFIRVNDNALWFFGGAPGAIVPDCLKSGVTKASKYEPDINPQYDDFARHYNTVILPARPHKATDKAYAENAVHLAYLRIFAPLRNRTFFSLEELNQAIWEQLARHNEAKFQRLDKTRKQFFEEIDKPALKPLPERRYELRRFQLSLAQFNYHVFLSEDKHYYSVPWQYRGKKVKLIYDQRNVEIFFSGKRIASFQRQRWGIYTTNKDHMPPQHRFYADWSPQKFISWAEKLGNYVKELIEKVLGSRQHPEQAFKVCLGILSLAKKCGNERLNLACKRALFFGSYSYKTVNNILTKGLEKVLDFPAQRQASLPSHENIRGSDYFYKEGEGK